MWKRLLTLALGSLACGGETDASRVAETEADDAVDARLMAVPAVETPWRPVAELLWGESTITFSALGEDDTLTIVVEQSNPNPHELDLYQRLRLGSDWYVTPAELWLHASGERNVPDLLALDHLSAAAQYDRPEAYQTTREGSPDPTVLAAKINVSNVVSGAFPAAPTTCWARLVTQIPSVDERAMYQCLSRNTGFGNSIVKSGDWTASSACSNEKVSQSELGTYRGAIFMEATGTGISPAKTQGCTGATQMSCGGVSNLANNTINVFDVRYSQSGRRASYGLANPQGTATRSYQYLFLRAELILFPPGPDGRTCGF